MSNHRILLVESDPQICRMFTENIDPLGDIRVDTVYYGEDIADCIEKIDYTAVIADISLINEADIEEIVKRGSEKHCWETVIILTSVTADRDSMIRIGTFKPMFLLKKPFDFGFVLKLVRQISEIRRLNEIVSENSESESDIERSVADVLKHIGISTNVKGYAYLSSAVISVMEKPEMIGHVTKLLYPKVAHMHHTTAATVERMIRHAIDEAWQRGDTEVLGEYFGYTVSRSRGRPTNSEFISCVANKIKH